MKIIDKFQISRMIRVKLMECWKKKQPGISYPKVTIISEIQAAKSTFQINDGQMPGQQMYSVPAKFWETWLNLLCSTYLNSSFPRITVQTSAIRTFYYCTISFNSTVTGHRAVECREMSRGSRVTLEYVESIFRFEFSAILGLQFYGLHFLELSGNLKHL